MYKSNKNQYFCSFLLTAIIILVISSLPLAFWAGLEYSIHYLSDCRNSRNFFTDDHQYSGRKGYGNVEWVFNDFRGSTICSV